MEVDKNGEHVESKLTFISSSIISGTIEDFESDVNDSIRSSKRNLIKAKKQKFLS